MEAKWKDWQNIKDTIPNLQLMEGRENSSKNATPFKEWFEGTDGSGKKNVSDTLKFREDNFIPNTGFDFDNFEEFYTKRKELMKLELVKVLNLITEQVN